MTDHNYMKYYIMKQGDFILDMGATDGDFAKEVFEDIEKNNAFILCVEPSPWSLKTLNSWAKGKKHVKVLEGVISNTSEKEEIILTSSAVLNYMTKSEQHWEHAEVDRILVDSYTIIDIFKKYGKISLVKCDVEGAEKFAFNTLTDTSMVDNFAIASYHIVDKEPTWMYLSKFFEGIGYHTLHEHRSGYDWTDMLYVSLTPLEWKGP